MTPKISVITIVHNRADTISRCVNSVLKQTYDNIEYIIQDGQSSDDTLAMLLAFNDDRIKLESRADRGLYDALNKALKRAKGDYVCFLHSDDYFAEKNIIELVCREIAMRKPDLVYGNIEFVTSEAKTVRRWVAGDYRRSALKFGWMPPHTSLFINRKKINEVGNFNTQYKISADYDHTLRLLCDPNTSVRYLPLSISCMSLGGASNGSFRKEFTKLKEDFVICFNHGFFLGFASIFKRIRKIPQFIRQKSDI